MKKFLSIPLIFALVFSVLAITPSTPSQAATKEILIARLNGNTLTCHKSTFNTNLKGNKDWQWENIVGYGKKLSYKVSPNCKFYTLSADSVTLSKVSRSTFKKKLYDYSKQRENGVTYYWGTAAKITIRGIVKITIFMADKLFSFRSSLALLKVSFSNSSRTNDFTTRVFVIFS